MLQALKRYDIIATILVFLLMIPAEKLELFSTIENQTLSIRHILRMTQGDPETNKFPADKVGIAYLDEDFFKEYGSFPLRRADVGIMVENLRLAGAKVVMVDMLMDFSSSYGEDPVIAAKIKAAGNNIFVSMLAIQKGQISGINLPTPKITEATVTAYSNHAKSGSMLNRLRIYPEAAAKYKEWPASVAAVAMYLGVEPTIENGILTIGPYSLILDQFGDFRTDFPTYEIDPERPFLHRAPEVGIQGMELLELDLEEEDEIEELKARVEGKIIFIGDTSEVSHDIFDTIVGEVYGVEVMADEVATIFKNGALKSATSSQEMVLLLLFMVLLIALHFIVEPIFRYLAAIFVLSSYFFYTTWAYIHYDLVYSMSYTLLAGLFGFIMINVYLFIQERKQKSFITGAFSQYLSPDVVGALVDNPDLLSLGGERREMTAYFSDVAGFSTISESLTPEELVQLLNEYLTEMCNIISNYNGTIDKFEGDAIIAFWGAPLDQPDHAIQSCHATVEMQNRMVEIRKKLAEEGRPELNVRMGVNSGPMVVGNMGSQSRMDYTMMGDAVNLAARLEGANKFYKNYTMISEFTYAQAKEAIDVRVLDTLTVVGKDQPITVYDLIEKKGMTTGRMADLVPQYLKGMDRYKNLDFAGAITEFEKALKIIPTDGPSITYIDRCKKFIAEPPPADWDLVFRLTEKG